MSTPSESPAVSITYHDTVEDVRATWASLALDGGYTLYVDASGALHALALGVTSTTSIREQGAHHGA